MRRMDDFDRQMRSAQRFAIFAGLIQMAIVISILGFVGWVIVKLMSHFGVL